MNMKSAAKGLGFVFLLSGQVFAATQVDMRDGEGDIQPVLIGDGIARMETGESGNYVLFDFANARLLRVDSEKSLIMEMDHSVIEGQAPAPKVEGELLKQGDGPVIAGFPTVHYRAQVEGMDCGDLYLSREALAVTNMKSLYAATLSMARQARATAATMGMVSEDKCDASSDLLLEQFEQYGMVMRSLDKNGVLENEVVNISLDVDLPADTFKLPGNFQRVDVKEQMRQAMSEFPDRSQLPQRRDLHRGEPEPESQQMQEPTEAERR